MKVSYPQGQHQHQAAQTERGEEHLRLVDGVDAEPGQSLEIQVRRAPARERQQRQHANPQRAPVATEAPTRLQQRAQTQRAAGKRQQQRAEQRQPGIGAQLQRDQGKRGSQGDADATLPQGARGDTKQGFARAVRLLAVSGCGHREGVSGILPAGRRIDGYVLAHRFEREFVDPDLASATVDHAEGKHRAVGRHIQHHAARLPIGRAADRFVAAVVESDAVAVDIDAHPQAGPVIDIARFHLGLEAHALAAIALGRDLLHQGAPAGVVALRVADEFRSFAADGFQVVDANLVGRRLLSRDDPGRR